MVERKEASAMADSMVKGLPPSLRAGSVKTVGNLMPTSSSAARAERVRRAPLHARWKIS